jgi:hypothetical protein
MLIWLTLTPNGRRASSYRLLTTRFKIRTRAAMHSLEMRSMTDETGSLLMEITLRHIKATQWIVCTKTASGQDRLGKMGVGGEIGLQIVRAMMITEFRYQNVHDGSLKSRRHGEAW